MAKPKNPLLSLGAQGTIGDALTFQRRGRGTIARKKPIPANPRSLAQTYHRWLYEDYAYLWRQQSEATKQEYRSEGAKRHLTGFSHWMSYQLTYLPDIAAWWTLDDNLGATCVDRSRNANTATIIGASPATGLIDGCLSFDGINDNLTIPYSPSLDFSGTSPLTIIALVYPFDPGASTYTIYSKQDTDLWLRLNGTPWGANLAFYHGGVGYLFPGNPLVGKWQSWLLCAARLDPLTNQVTLFINNDTAVFALASAAVGGPNPSYIGRAPSTYFLKGSLDNVIVGNTAFSNTRILKWLERRYPL